MSKRSHRKRVKGTLCSQRRWNTKTKQYINNPNTTIKIKKEN